MKFDKLTIDSIKNKSDEAVKIITNDGDIEIKAYHEQDCCERVYADFSVLEYHLKDLIGFTFQEIFIKPVAETGFLLCFEHGERGDEESYDDYEIKKILIPCYNEQNGYYSSNLELIIKHGDTKEVTDISDCVEDHIG